MARDTGYLQYIIEEVMRDIPGITSRGMFGGYGIYKDGLVFSMIIEGSLYFKVDESNKKDYEEQGSNPFMYENKNGKKVAMGYWRVPEEVLEDQSLIREWVEKAVAVSRSKKK